MVDQELLGHICLHLGQKIVNILTTIWLILICTSFQKSHTILVESGECYNNKYDNMNYVTTVYVSSGN